MVALVTNDSPAESGIRPILEDFRTSDKQGDLAAAVARARAKMGNIGKNASNPYFGSTYADLAAVTDAIAPLFEEGVMVFQSPGTYDPAARLVRVHTRLIHTSGEWIHSTVEFPVIKSARKKGAADGVAPPPNLPPNAQDLGSAITYARRYSLQAMLCLAAEDDDGNAAAGRTGKSVLQQPDEDPRTAEEPGWFKTEPLGASEPRRDEEREKQVATYRAFERQLLECQSLEDLAASWKSLNTAKKRGLLDEEQFETLSKVKDTCKASFEKTA